MYRMRLGRFISNDGSYDLRQHAVGVQVQSIFGMHNRTNFEVYAYNVNDGKRDGFQGSVNDKIRRVSDFSSCIVTSKGSRTLRRSWLCQSSRGNKKVLDEDTFC